MRNIGLTILSAACLVLSGQSLCAASGYSAVHVGGHSGGYTGGRSMGRSGGFSWGRSVARPGRRPGFRSNSPAYYTYYTYSYQPYTFPYWEVPASPGGGGSPAERVAARERDFAKSSGYELGRPGYAITYRAAKGRDGSVSVSDLEWRSKAGAIAKSKWEH